MNKINVRLRGGQPVDSITLPPQVCRGLTASPQQMKSTHVIYRQRFLLQNNCGERGRAAIDAYGFFAVGSCSIGRNERWRRDRFCVSNREKRSEQMFSSLSSWFLRKANFLPKSEHEGFDL